MKKQSGFTLIELVVVIIILGVLAAVAVPKFIDMSIDAHNAAAKGVSGALASGGSINFAARTAGSASAVAINQASVCAAAVLQPLLTGNGVTLSDSAPSSDDSFQVAAQSSGSGDCSGTAVSAICTVLPRGSGVTAAPVNILCAR